MVKKLRKVLIIGVVLIMSLGILCACNNDDSNIGDNNNNDNQLNDNFDNKCNAELLHTMTTYLHEDYLIAHSTKNSESIYNPDYPNDIRPREYIELITDSTKYDMAFKSFPKEVDFENQMLVLYFYTGCMINAWDGEALYKYSFKDIIFDENDLQIEIYKTSLAPDNAPRATPPEQECLVIIIDKLNVETISVKIQYGSLH